MMRVLAMDEMTDDRWVKRAEAQAFPLRRALAVCTTFILYLSILRR
jgi:hypothetical protein